MPSRYYDSEQEALIRVMEALEAVYHKSNSSGHDDQKRETSHQITVFRLVKFIDVPTNISNRHRSLAASSVAPAAAVAVTASYRTLWLGHYGFYLTMDIGTMKYCHALAGSDSNLHGRWAVLCIWALWILS